MSSMTFFGSVLRGLRIPSPATRSAATPTTTKALRPRPRNLKHNAPSCRALLFARVLPESSKSSTSTARRIFHTSPPGRQVYQRFGGQRTSSSSRYTQILYLLRRWAARPTFYYEVGGLTFASGSFYVYNLEEVPISRRRRFNIFKEGSEESLGQSQVQSVLQQYRGRILSEHDPRVRQVRRVLDRLVPATGALAGRKWQVTVIDSDETNAFVVPGGHVFVFTGILPICEDDDGLATVLGHEIGHNVAHHIAEKMSRNILLSGTALILELAGLLPAQFSQVLLQLVFEMPGSRKQESEADYIGLMMMAESCFNPEAAVRFWDRMERMEKQKGAPPEMLSTHPSSHNRQGQLVEWLPQAQDKFATSECGITGQHIGSFRRSFDRML